jgi:hypothetical protein
MTAIMLLIHSIPPVLLALSVVCTSIGTLLTLLGATLPRAGKLARLQEFCAKWGSSVGHIGSVVSGVAARVSTRVDDGVKTTTKVEVLALPK